MFGNLYDESKIPGIQTKSEMKKVLTKVGFKKQFDTVYCNTETNIRGGAVLRLGQDGAHNR